jgi:hypothetical protein
MARAAADADPAATSSGEVCRGLQLADATQGTSETLTGERADVDMMEKLGLLEGHLLIGRQLLQANMSADAQPHFGHPAEEIYTYLAAQIERRGAPAFRDELMALQAQARLGAADPFGLRYDAVMTKVEALRATVPAERRAAPAFVLGVVAQLVTDVASDYNESIERGRIANKIEYHDAMGFLTYVTGYAERAGQGATGRAVRAFRATQAELRAARAGFPALQPPARPAITVASLRGRAARIADLAKTV